MVFTNVLFFYDQDNRIHVHTGRFVLQKQNYFVWVFVSFLGFRFNSVHDPMLEIWFVWYTRHGDFVPGTFSWTKIWLFQIVLERRDTWMRMLMTSTFISNTSLLNDWYSVYANIWSTRDEASLIADEYCITFI